MIPDRLATLPATFTTGEAVAAGVWRRELYRLRDEGQLVELSRGVFRKADAPETPWLDMLGVAQRAPQGVVCLLSALAIHELTDEVPIAVQIAVPRGAHRPRIAYPPVEVSQFDRKTFALGQETVELAPGESVAAFDAARSVVDVMRLRKRVGEPVALHALRRYVSQEDARVADLASYARALGAEGPVRRAVEAVMS